VARDGHLRRARCGSGRGLLLAHPPTLHLTPTHYSGPPSGSAATVSDCGHRTALVRSVLYGLRSPTAPAQHGQHRPRAETDQPRMI
jgi:hypothetical protein